jgi:hypothetical protein
MILGWLYDEKKNRAVSNAITFYGQWNTIPEGFSLKGPFKFDCHTKAKADDVMVILNWHNGKLVKLTDHKFSADLYPGDTVNIVEVKLRFNGVAAHNPHPPKPAPRRKRPASLAKKAPLGTET